MNACTEIMSGRARSPKGLERGGTSGAGIMANCSLEAGAGKRTDIDTNGAD